MRLRVCLSILAVTSLLPLSLFAKCPISPNGRLELRAPAGNLEVDTTGTDSVEVSVNNSQVTIQENCERDKVTVTGKAPTKIGIPDWKIRVPRGVTLDLSTQGGSIQVADTDGEALLRTSGGKVTAGNIKGNALFMATEVRAGNIGGNAELRGIGGRLQVGDVGGNAEFYTEGGDITAGLVKGSVKADMKGGSITIRESNGNVVVATREGDIISNYVHGSFDGKTESGNIRIEKAGSWVKAITGLGDIFFRLVPNNLAADLHVTAEATGEITMYVPKAMKATFDVVVEKPALRTRSILSDIPRVSIDAVRSLLPGGPEKQTFEYNKGGNAIKLRTSGPAGTIRIMQGN